MEAGESVLDAAGSPALLPHRRRNPLTGEWVLVSPQRFSRPWLGQIEENPVAPSTPYATSCYLCPGNTRANGVRNPQYTGAYSFDNDFPALVAEMDAPIQSQPELLQSLPQTGTCRVLCFSPRHDQTLADMSMAEVRTVVDLWAEQTEELGRTYRWVQVFENKGEMMGSSNPHPHGQVWATVDLPSQAAKEDAHQRDYWQRHGRPLLTDYANLEANRGERIVAENEDWLVVVPFWAEWPFETLLLPRTEVLRLPDLGDRQRMALAAILKTLLVRYDNLFAAPFPYSMGWHGAPYPQTPREGQASLAHWQLHCHFYPPLLRSSTVRKFQVGYELLAEAQRDLMPERAAGMLRGVSDLPAQRREDAP